MKKRICIIGAGNLGLAITNGLLADYDKTPVEITVTKRSSTRPTNLDARVQLMIANALAIQEASIIVIAVKPYDVEKVLNDIKESLQENQIIISVATGVTIQSIREILGQSNPIFRAMPNTASDIQESMTCIASDCADFAQQEEVRSFFSAIGQTIFIKEELMEAATVLGACGIAYVLRFIRSMVQGGIQIGFDAKTASDIVNQVVKGAAELLIERHSHPEAEIDKVTTPKGCTIVGLNEMEHNGFSSSLIKGISASIKAIEN
jgi:pyrroline-5-carboxylate reductase